MLLYHIKNENAKKCLGCKVINIISFFEPVYKGIIKNILVEIFSIFYMDDQSISHGTIERAAYLILWVMVILLPFFFVPGNFLSFQSAKGLLFSAGIVISLSLLIVSMIKNARLFVPKNLLSLSMVLLPIAFLASSLANGAKQFSLLGFSFEVGTVSFVFLVSMFALMVAQLFQSKERGFYAHIGILISFAVIALFQIVRLLFGPEVLTFGMFTSSLSNLVGNWNDLAVFFGATTLLSLVTIDMVELKSSFRFVAYIVLVLSLLILFVVNFITIWIVLAVFSLIFFLFLASFDKFLPSRNPVDHEATNPHVSPRKVSLNALAVFIVSLAFVFFGTFLGENIATRFDAVSVEIRPGWATTFSVIKGSVAENALFGVGPNNFLKTWLVNKPLGVNETVFWGTDFSAGIGLLPTLIATTGLVGLLAILFFLVMYVRMGIKALFSQSEDSLSRYLVSATFFLSLFYLVVMFVYVPSAANVVLAFFFIGLFMASLYRENILGSTVLSLDKKPKTSFASVLVLVVLLLLNISLGYLVARKTIALGYFEQGIASAQETADISVAETALLKAIGFDKNDLYYRGLSELNLIRVDQVLSREGATPESIREEFQLNIANSIENARVATQINPDNYLNWLTLARVYAALVPDPFAIPGAYENAKKTYEEAERVNPKSPLIALQLARLEVSNKDLTAARVYVNTAIQRKGNFAEAHFLLAQIEVTEGNLKQAISSLNTTVLLTPNNPGLLFQLGLLKYNDQDWNGAVEAFGQAVKLVPEYANAKYFLGLAFSQLSSNAEALKQFNELAQSNPDNEEVKLILSNLEAGRDPFANAVPPITSSPEKRKTLPIEESN